MKIHTLLNISEVFGFHKNKICTTEKFSKSLLADDEHEIIDSIATSKDFRNLRAPSSCILNMPLI